MADTGRGYSVYIQRDFKTEQRKTSQKEKKNEHCEFDSDEMERNYRNRFIIDATYMVGLRSFVIPFFYRTILTVSG